MATEKKVLSPAELLKEQLKKIEKVEIPFDLPVLERVKLECESFLTDMEVTIRDTKVKFSYVPLGIGRAVYRLLKAKPELVTLWDKKKLTVQVIEKDVSELVKEGKQMLYLSGEEHGIGFEVLNHVRVADETVDVQLVELSINTVKANTSKENTIYVQDDKAKALRLEIRRIVTEEARIAKEKKDKEEAQKEAEKKAKASTSATGGHVSIALPAMPVKPERSDVKYDGMFGDLDFDDDVAAYPALLSAWEKACEKIKAEQEAVADGQLSIDDIEQNDSEDDDDIEDEEEEDLPF